MTLTTPESGRITRQIEWQHGINLSSLYIRDQRFFIFTRKLYKLRIAALRIGLKVLTYIYMLRAFRLACLVLLASIAFAGLNV